MSLISAYIFFVLFILLAISVFFNKKKVVANFFQPALLGLLGLNYCCMMLLGDTIEQGVYGNINNLPGEWHVVIYLRTYAIALIGLFMACWYFAKLYRNINSG